MAINSTNMSTTYSDIIALRSTELLMGETVAGLIIANAESDRGGRVGNTIIYHRAPKGTIRNAAEGAGNGKTYDATVGSTDSLTLDYFKEISFEVDDLDQNVIGATGPGIDSYAISSAKQLATQIDADIIEDIFDDAGILDNAAIGSEATAINDKTFRDVRAALVKLGVNPADIVILLSPDHSAEALGIDVFKSSDYVNTMPVINGQLPRNIYKMSVYMDLVNMPTLTAADSISGSSTTEYLSLAMHKDAVKFVSVPLYQPNTQNAEVGTATEAGLSLRTKRWYDPDLNVSRLVTDALYGVKLLKHASANSATDNSVVVPIRGGAS